MKMYKFEELGYTTDGLDKFGGRFTNKSQLNQRGIPKAALFDVNEERFILNFTPNEEEVIAINEIRSLLFK